MTEDARIILPTAQPGMTDPIRCTTCQVLMPRPLTALHVCPFCGSRCCKREPTDD